MQRDILIKMFKKKRKIKMAIRKIRYDEDPVLRVKCKPVNEITSGLKKVINDMYDTMYDSNGVGLAAPQIGIVKRVVVIDDYNGNKYTLINPQIISTVGEQVSLEGCLSLPGFCGKVKRPMKVVVRAQNIDGKVFEIKAEDMLATILSHEIDHLEGILYKDKAFEYGKPESFHKEGVDK